MGMKILHHYAVENEQSAALLTNEDFAAVVTASAAGRLGLTVNFTDRWIALYDGETRIRHWVDLSMHEEGQLIADLIAINHDLAGILEFHYEGGS